MIQGWATGTNGGELRGRGKSPPSGVYLDGAEEKATAGGMPLLTMAATLV